MLNELRWLLAVSFVGLCGESCADAASPIDLRYGNQRSAPVGIERNSPYLYRYDNDWQRNRPWRERRNPVFYPPVRPVEPERPPPEASRGGG